ncbi:hypothetical protein [Streptomyces sp. A 4/2]|uniref:hypothetical protein n=1 Tax=Streptomyces sp. A 4/2 TaxID=2934314 RepID=UPI002024D2FC|nr:hypothetical protein [Streptomyces sp. A 4/2]
MTTSALPPTALPAPALRLLRAAGFVSSFDRFCIAPMLVLISTSIGVPLPTVVLAARGYYLGYGLMQPVWGLAGDPDRPRPRDALLPRLVLFGAGPERHRADRGPRRRRCLLRRVHRRSLTYVGDTVPAETRQRPLSELMTAFALGTTVAAGVLAHYLSWRVVFAVPGLLAAALVPALRQLPEPVREPAGPLLAPFRVVLRSGWQW